MKFRNVFLFGATAVLLAFSFVLFGCSDDLTDLTDFSVSVKYQITGDVGAVDSLTYKNALGDYIDLLNVVLPWEKTISVVADSGDFYEAYVTATVNQDCELVAKIFLENNQIHSSTSSFEAPVTVTAKAKIIFNTNL